MARYYIQKSFGQVTSGQNLSIGDNATTEYRPAKGFTLASATTIHGASFRFYPGNGSPAGNVEWRIETDNAGKPSGTLADANLTEDTSPAVASDTYMEAFYAIPTSIASGTYWLVLQCDNQATDNAWGTSYDNTNPLTGDGSLACYSNNSGSTWNTPYADFNHAIYRSEEYNEKVVIDQSVNDTDWTLGDYNNTEYRSAQSISLANAETVTSISIYFNAKVNTPDGNITVKVETDNAGDPSGTLVDATATTYMGEIPDNAWTNFSFTTPFALAASTTYWIVVDCPDQTTTQEWKVARTNTSQYAGGIASLKTNGAWAENVNYDLTFRLYSEPLATSTQAVIIS